MKRLSIYIHIPFCAKKCSYCNFVSYCTKGNEIDGYIYALKKEIDIQSKTYKEPYIVSSIFVGGGTPSFLPSGAIEKIISYVKEKFAVGMHAEITVEGNPNSLTREKLEEYKRCGVNRISIGGQTINDKILKSIGRIHNFKDLDVAINNAKAVGFKNINVDMLVGLPGQKMADIKKMLKYLVKKGIPHISAYSLIVEDGTQIKRQLENGELKLPSDDDTVDMYDFVVSFLKKYGINRYEVSNFSVSDCECKHNINYWEMGEYLGLGVAAHSYIQYKRFNNTTNLEEYIEKLSQGKLAIEGKENITLPMMKEEYIMLGLRTTRGIYLPRFNGMFNCNLLADKAKEIKFLLDNKLIRIENDRIKVRDDAYYVLNSIIQKLV